jgi:hypothetical protein
LTVTLVGSAYDNGRRCDGTLGEFFAFLCDPHRPLYAKDKKATPGFLPGILADYTPLEPYTDKLGNTHKPKNVRNKNVTHITLGVADFEKDGDFVPTIEHIAAPLDRTGVPYVIKSSFSHGVPGKGPRYRAIWPLREPIFVGTKEAAAAYSVSYQLLRRRWGWHHDLSCANVGRIFHDGFYDGRSGLAPVIITGGLK